MDTPTLLGLIVTVLGTVASIWGAIISLKQSRLAKRAATEAERVRAQLVRQRQTSELAALKVHCERAVRSMEKYGPGASPSSLNGINPTSDAGDVQRLMLEANALRTAFGHGEAEIFANKIGPLLQRFVSAGEAAHLKSNGQAVLMEASNFFAVIRSTLDDSREGP